MINIRSPQLAGLLEHFQFDTFIARWTDRQLMADAYVSFYLRYVREKGTE